jgi:MoxR-like ATPase
MVEPTPSLADDAAAVTAATHLARRGLVDREVLADVVLLCAVAGEHLLVIGPPGTAKSEAVRRVAGQLGGSYFEYLLGRFTEPNEVFGPVDLQRLREGVVEIQTGGMLPEADIAFLDEIFLGSTAILNTLLALLNERVFRRGSTHLHAPLRLCVGAANRLPDDPALDAFADRFLARVFLDAVPDARLEELLETGRTLDTESAAAPTQSLLPAVDRLAAASRGVDLAGVRAAYATAVRRLRAAGISVSDRRVVRAQRLVAAAAVLDGRLTAGPEDLWVLPVIAPTLDAQALARETLSDLLRTSRNTGLTHAAEELSRGPLARAARLAETAEHLLTDSDGDPTAAEDLRLRIEATLREIDAGFDPARLPEPLAEVRPRLIAALGQPTEPALAPASSAAPSGP